MGHPFRADKRIIVNRFFYAADHTIDHGTYRLANFIAQRIRVVILDLFAVFQHSKANLVSLLVIDVI